eukprot:371358_1
MEITFNGKNMANLSSIMVASCQEILFRFYSLQFGSYLCYNKCVLAIKKKTDSYKAVSMTMNALDSHDNSITTHSVIIHGVYMGLSCLEWLKFYYILALIQ